jgi:hypothetical protein
MRNDFARAMVGFVAMIAFSLGLWAQTAARPDLSGIWDSASPNVSQAGPGQGPGAAVDSLGGVPAPGFSKEEAPMTDSALRIYRPRREGRIAASRGREEADPSFYPYCMPRTFPRVYNFYPVIEIIQSPAVVHMLFENDHQVRRIYLDGKKHLEGWHPTSMGTSHGRWDGDALVVETDNILSLDNHGWLDSFGHPFTDALRVTERIRRPAQDTLQIDFTFTDPGAYTRPWTGKKVFRLSQGVDLIDTGFCEQAQQDDYLRDIRAGKPGGRPLY